MLGGGASLLPGGITSVSGDFTRGDMVEIETVHDGESRIVARGISQYAASEVRRIAGRRSLEIEAVLGYSYGETVVHRDDLVAVTGAGA